MKWFVKCIRNYVNFRGRARRKEYWYFILFSFIFMIVAWILDALLFGSPFTRPTSMAVSPISMLFSLFIFLPQLAVMTRRLHDTGHSGKWVLGYYVLGFVWVIALIATGFSFFVGAMSGSHDAMPGAFLAVLFGGCLLFLVLGIVFLVWFCTPGESGENKYGPDPKAVEEQL